MQTTINIRCSCTMEKVGDGRWNKPASGYKKPNPDCPQCHGKGQIVASIDEDAEVWLGRCRQCGINNGVHFQNEGESPPKPDPYLTCLLDLCPGSVDWVQENEVKSYFEAICPVCSVSYSFVYLRRESDPPPTVEIACQKCEHNPLSWNVI